MNPLRRMLQWTEKPDDEAQPDASSFEPQTEAENGTHPNPVQSVEETASSQGIIAEHNAENSTPVVPKEDALNPASPVVIRLEFNLPKIEDKGEDANPVMIWQAPRGVLAVFDGMGGAGSTVYQRRGKSYSGAYIASRVAAAEVGRCFSPSFPLPTFPLADSDVGELRQLLSDALKREAAQLEVDVEPSRIKSKLIKRLPTTMAALLVEQQTTSVICQSLWAGDSRCYALSAETGLQQLTTDDLKSGGDALDNLKNDSPMSNCLNADEEFQLHSSVQNLSLPVIVLSVTDGCFGYLFSPAHFEFLLLDSLMLSKDAAHWQDTIISRLQKMAGDDCSLCLLALGWPTYQVLQSAFSKRHQMLKASYIEPLDVLSAEISQDVAALRQIETRKNEAEKRREELRQQLWSRYKETHDGLLVTLPIPTKNKAGEIES